MSNRRPGSGEHRLHFGPADESEPATPEQAVQDARNAQLRSDLRAGVLGRALKLCINAIRQLLADGMTPNTRIALTDALMRGEAIIKRYYDELPATAKRSSSDG